MKTTEGQLAKLLWPKMNKLKNAWKGKSMTSWIRNKADTAALIKLDWSATAQTVVRVDLSNKCCNEWNCPNTADLIQPPAAQRTLSFLLLLNTNGDVNNQQVTNRNKLFFPPRESSSSSVAEQKLTGAVNTWGYWETNNGCCMLVSIWLSM